MSINVRVEFEFEQNSEGRRGPIFESYRPSFVLGTRNADCCFHLIDSDRINPGEKTTVDIHILNSMFDDSLRPGTLFTIAEGAKRVGNGRVLYIL